jgi:hypothetical protein
MIPMPTKRTINQINRRALADIESQIKAHCDAYFFDKRNPDDPMNALFAKRAFERIQRGEFSAVKRGLLRILEPLLAARSAVIEGMKVEYIYQPGDDLSQDQADALERSWADRDRIEREYRERVDALIRSQQRKAGARKPQVAAQRRKRTGSTSLRKANRSVRKAKAA